MTDTHRFLSRHLGPREHELEPMLRTCGCASLDELIKQTIPADIRLREPLELPPELSEHEALTELRRIASRNVVARSLIGMGYSAAITPAVLQRNILEHPGWYTAYTPYQAEIAQGRLEALLIFQTMVSELTAMPIANASLLDEATAAAEAMTMARRVRKGRGNRFFVAADCHPQTIAVMQTRAAPLGIEIIVGPPDDAPLDDEELFGLLVQYPATDGVIRDYESLCRNAAERGVVPVVATDLLALTLLRPPGEFGAKIVVGSTQRFGLPMWYGGPHAAFLATVAEYVRQVPGRIVGVSKDARGRPALRLAIQTREQHIRRDKATSNICTAQVLPAVVAAMYAVWHGPSGLRQIATRIATLTGTLRYGLRQLGCEVTDGPVFDTLRVRPVGDSGAVLDKASQKLINLRDYGDGTLGVSLDERSTAGEVATLLEIFGAEPQQAEQLAQQRVEPAYPEPLARTSAYLTDPVFSQYHSETEMMRYLHRLADRDLALNRSMIPLGSCTMKLNAAAELLPVTWPELAELHPFAPAEQAAGYRELFAQLCDMLRMITGLPHVTLQPNAGAQGEYAGLLAIRAYHAARGEPQRDVCLIPTSAHGTNPASAVMAGCRVVPVACDERGNIDVSDLRAKAAEHAERLAALMITYPSTHGVFEEQVREICAIVHEFGGQVYMDGANLNAQCGLTRPAEIGADVVHLNLHKTFAIPHGGGGPGVGPIAVAEHLAPFLPRHPLDPWAGQVDCGQPPSTGHAEHGGQPPSAGMGASRLDWPGDHAPPTGHERPTAKPSEVAYRRKLPHIQAENRPVMVTFVTHERWQLPPAARKKVLEHCLFEHGRKILLHTVVVMPDHVHMIFTPLCDDRGRQYGLPEIMHGIKGASAHSINKLLGRSGRVWQDESHDRILRREESLVEKGEYILHNPVRKGLVARPDDYPWLWCEWKYAPAGPGLQTPGEDPSGQRKMTAEGGCHPRQPGAAVPQDSRGRLSPTPSPHAVGPVAAAPWGSPGVLCISWMYIRMMGADGLRRVSEVAILNANYMAARLAEHYPVLYTNRRGRVGHEFILDLRPLKKSAGIEPDDVAKRLMDFGFHAPTMSFPVPGTLMIEPTESEPKAELDRFCDAMIAIREEIRRIEQGQWPHDNNPLKRAPHTADDLVEEPWQRPYSRELAVFPAPWVRERKYWPPVNRIDNPWGDRHLFCSCAGVLEVAAAREG